MFFVENQRELRENDEISITSIDSFLEEDYAEKRKINLDQNIPFDEKNLNSFNIQYEKFKEFINKEELEQ